MNPRSSTATESFPSLSGGLGADELGLRQFESSLDRIVSGSRAQERVEPDTHAYNSHFQFFYSKRTSAINDSPLNDLANREDSLVKAWRTVSEIDALLGSDFRPSMPTYEEDRPNPVDEMYVKRLNSELEAAMNVSLTFKERYRASRGPRNCGGSSGGGGAGGGAVLGVVGGPVGGPAAGPTVPTSRCAAPASAFPKPSPRQRLSDASGGGGGAAAAAAASSSSYHQLQNQIQQNNYHPQQQYATHHAGTSSPLISPRRLTSAAAAAVAATSASAPNSGGGGVGGPAAVTATLTATGLRVAGGDGNGDSKGLSSYPSVHGPAPSASPGPPPPSWSVQVHAISTPTSEASPAPPSASAPSPAQPAAAAASPPQQCRRLHGGGIRVAVGSALDHGAWDSDGIWRSADPTYEVYVPQHLQRISPDDLVKVRELGRGCFGSVWLVKWRGVEVALKELLNQNILDGPANEVFYEAERLAALRHPCVIAFYGIVTSPGCYATVVEYMRMGSLKSGLNRLRKQGADISRRLRAAIALQAARGMEYLHSQFLVHFDLKCDNLLCDLRDPARPVVKIGDLGLSKKKKDSFVSGNMRGTLPWMAPELFPGVREKQRQEAAAAAVASGSNGAAAAAATVGGGITDGGGGMNILTTVATTATVATTQTANADSGGPDCPDDRVNEKVDVFSFGIVLWEIWQLGEQPYSSYSLADIFAGVMTGSLRPAVPADCEADWAALMQACWQGNPRCRPSFTEVADRLDAMLERLARQETATAAAAAAAAPGGDGGGGGMGIAPPALGSRRF